MATDPPDPPDRSDNILKFPTPSAANNHNDMPWHNAKLFLPRLPILYRLREANGQLAYKLSDKDSTAFVGPKWEPVHMLDPAIDHGWMIIQHHIDFNNLRSYINAQLDSVNTLEDYRRISGMFIIPNEGIFTLRRQAPPKGAPDHLLIYVYEQNIEDTTIPMGDDSNFLGNNYLIFHSDGSVTHDPTILRPFLQRP